MMSIEELYKSSNLLFKAIRGSRCHGLETETSDVDTFGVFCCPIEQLLGLGYDYQEVIQSEKGDDAAQELKKFINLLSVSNPNALEALYIEPTLVLYKSPLMEPLIKNRDRFLSKACFHSFFSYARSQLNKMSGQGKAMNLKPGSMVKKTILEFCTVLDTSDHLDTGIRVSEFLEKKGISQELCGVSKHPKSNNIYKLFYKKDLGFSTKA